MLNFFSSWIAANKPLVVELVERGGRVDCGRPYAEVVERLGPELRHGRREARTEYARQLHLLFWISRQIQIPREGGREDEIMTALVMVKWIEARLSRRDFHWLLLLFFYVVCRVPLSFYVNNKICKWRPNWAKIVLKDLFYKYFLLKVAYHHIIRYSGKMSFDWKGFTTAVFTKSLSRLLENLDQNCMIECTALCIEINYVCNGMWEHFTNECFNECFKHFSFNTDGTYLSLNMWAVPVIYSRRHLKS